MIKEDEVVDEGNKGKKSRKGKKEEEAVVDEVSSAIEMTASEKLFKDLRERYLIQAEHCFLAEHPSQYLMRCAALAHEQLIIDNTPEELDGPIGYGFLKIEPEGALRTSFLNKIIDRPWFENFILFCIVASCGEFPTHFIAYAFPNVFKCEIFSFRSRHFGIRRAWSRCR